ncbi:LacI family DNA-binding transcriptional regulator [Pseudoalteromonas sp. Angola-30]|uniref:LacI family DNA-binding transcriptional regulator n=1 Tax=Pseudoalteromonas sp. Angola-30 TaxID=3025341 RepID=UPI00235A0FB7|nr:LacI family DNA-binding transcriptional regulator [Pseudoalteromonas sp. Angola-30]MDC9526835.1 LacI family DNA-binding transcriptional regulator [Pseudoalteromonas sp. Angola-30]
MAEPRRTRIQDVAEQAGVSMMTVSRVLNQDKKVSNKTREKVMAVVEKLNYHPNVSARRLASSKSFFIGLLYDNPSDSYISQFLLAALKKCRALGYHLVVDEAHLDINKTIESVKQLIDVTQVDGMILLPPMCDNEDVLEVLTKANVPFVRITPDTKLNSSPYICMDDYQAAFDVTERLINQGHKKIAHIIGNNNQGVSRLRYQGYLDALRSNKIITPPEYIEQGSFTYQSGMEAAVKLLALDDKPTAIFAANDDMAAAVISIAQQQGINIPGALSVVGFDDTQLARSVWPHISTVKQPINEMAELSVSLLASGQYDNKSNLKSLELRHILDFELIERESSSIK